jgi:hypothetical protein
MKWTEQAAYFVTEETIYELPNVTLLSKESRSSTSHSIPLSTKADEYSVESTFTSGIITFI